MDLIASFEAKKVRSFHFFNVTDLFGASAVPFLFDTGAACSIIGVSNLFAGGKGKGYDDGRRQLFENTLKRWIDTRMIPERVESLKTANKQMIRTYP